MGAALERVLAHCAAGRTMRESLLNEGLLMGLGNVYYVNGITWANGFGAGSDGNDGLSPDSPLMTITAALAKCTDEADDYIVVLDYWQGTGETWPISVDKALVHLMGLPGFLGDPWPMLNPDGDFAALSIAAQNVEIAYLELYGGATHGCVEIPGVQKAFAIHHCHMGCRSTAQDGIRVASAANIFSALIAYNRFGRGLSRDGIRVAADGHANEAVIHNNLFRQVGSVAINILDTAARLSAILDNRFGLKTGDKGEAITFGGGAECFVDGNRANVGTTNMTNNPYLDLGSNDWGVNYKGIVATMPATS